MWSEEGPWRPCGVCGALVDVRDGSTLIECATREPMPFCAEHWDFAPLVTALDRLDEVCS